MTPASLAAANARAEASALRAFPTIVHDLVSILGVRAVGVLGGVSQSRMVSGWIGGTKPRGEAESRLRLAMRAASILRERLPDEAVRAWFLGSNHNLEDETPLTLVATGDLGTDSKRVLNAARATLSL